MLLSESNGAPASMAICPWIIIQISHAITTSVQNEIYVRLLSGLTEDRIYNRTRVTPGL